MLSTTMLLILFLPSEIFLKKYENASLSEIYEKVKVLTLAHEMKRDEQIKLVIQGLMGLHNDCKSLIVKYKQIFSMYTSSDGDARILLASMEEFIVHKAELLNHSHSILECLYDEDLVDADEIMEWYQSVDDDQSGIRGKVKPFIEWLNEEDEDGGQNA